MQAQKKGSSGKGKGKDGSYRLLLNIGIKGHFSNLWLWACSRHWAKTSNLALWDASRRTDSAVQWLLSTFISNQQ